MSCKHGKVLATFVNTAIQYRDQFVSIVNSLILLGNDQCVFAQKAVPYFILSILRLIIHSSREWVLLIGHPSVTTLLLETLSTGQLVNLVQLDVLFLN